MVGDAHLDAHLADRTTVGVWIVRGAVERGRCWVGIMSRIVHTNEQDSAHRSSSSVVRPSHLYLPRNLECSVKPTTISSFFFSLCSLIATVPSMTCFGDGRLDRGLVLSAF